MGLDWVVEGGGCSCPCPCCCPCGCDGPACCTAGVSVVSAVSWPCWSSACCACNSICTSGSAPAALPPASPDWGLSSFSSSATADWFSNFFWNSSKDMPLPAAWAGEGGCKEGGAGAQCDECMQKFVKTAPHGAPVRWTCSGQAGSNPPRSWLAHTWRSCCMGLCGSRDLHETCVVR